MRRISKVIKALPSVFVVGLALMISAMMAYGCERSATNAAKRGKSSTDKAELSIAVASSVKPAMDAIVLAWAKVRPDVEVTVTFGASGNLYAQIVNGAPFDIFYSADTLFPEKLIEMNVGLRDSLRTYATGQLVIWAATATGLDVRRGFELLSDTKVRHIAIANPEHAPYGRAAREAITLAGVAEVATPKLVLGANVEQTAQFAQSGAADVAIIPLSLARTPRLGTSGAYWSVPQRLYRMIEHGVVRIANANSSSVAAEFDAYVAGPDALRMLEQAGLGRSE